MDDVAGSLQCVRNCCIELQSPLPYMRWAKKSWLLLVGYILSLLTIHLGQEWDAWIAFGGCLCSVG